MTKRIFRAILSVAAVVAAACAGLILWVLYDSFSSLSAAQLEERTGFVARGVELEGETYISGLDTEKCRITWISPEGTVLFDTETDPAEMENHADREEVAQALAEGTGKSVRYSATLTRRMLYYAQRLADGSVIRVSETQNSVLALVLGLVQPMLLILVLAIALSALLASRLSRRIVKPLNTLNLDAPLDNEAYEELAPLLTRIEKQHRKIAAQEDSLRRKQEEWDTVTGSMGEGIVLLNSQGTVLSINRAATGLLCRGEDCRGLDFLSVCRRPDIQGLLAESARGRRGECSLRLEEREYRAEASPVLSEGVPAGTALLFIDVTEKARREQLRREFTANVSHELKTPLHTIAGTAELLENGLVEPEDIPRFIRRIAGEAQRMIALVNDILQLSGLDEGADNGPREPLSLKTLSEAVAARLTPEAEKKAVSLAVSGSPGSMTGSPALVTQLLYNLCDNAIKYNREGGRVEIATEDTPEGASVTVTDTGIGIPPADRDRVFERFYRVDKSRSREMGGTGLGLSIVKHVALLHHARITLESRPDEGTAIRVDFPGEGIPQ